MKFFVLSVFFLLSFAPPLFAVLPRRCEPVKTPMCSNLGSVYNSKRMYNTTMYPNVLSHRNQEEASLEMHQFLPLVRVGCSKYLQLFLCTIYMPMCAEPRILPCRSLCEEARNGCQPLMLKFGFQWPETLKCEKYPKMEDKVCFGGPKNSTVKETAKEKTCTGCLDKNIRSERLKQLCSKHDLVIIGEVMNIRGDRKVKFRVKKQLKVKSNIGKVIKKRLQHKRLMVKLTFPKKQCIGKCSKFEMRKTYVVFLNVKKGKRAIYNQAGVLPYQQGMKIC